MKKLFTDYYNNIKENYNLERKILLINSIVLIICSTLGLIFERLPDTLTILYLFPLAIIVLSITSLLYVNNYKELDNKYWLVELGKGLILLLFAFYLIINPIKTENTFMIFFSSLMIFLNLIKLFTAKENSLFKCIKIGIVSLVSIFIIIFNKFIINELYLYFLILVLLYGILKIVTYFVVDKIKK